jgi:hypothetical protein
MKHTEYVTDVSTELEALQREKNEQVNTDTVQS